MILLLFLIAQGQTSTIQGIITGSDTREGLVGVNIILEGTVYGTIYRGDRMDLSLWKAPARSRLEMLTSSRVNEESRRMGFDMEIKLQLAQWIWADMDLNVAWNEAQFDTESRLFDLKIFLISAGRP